MAENKQYITQAQEKGNIMISEEVIATIVTRAATEVEGVVGMSTKPGADIVELLGKKSSGKGLRISFEEDDSVSIDCDLILSYGQSVVCVAASVQEAVTSALESMTGVSVNAVNVNVCGITRQ